MRYNEVGKQHFPFKDPTQAFGMAIDLLPKKLEMALRKGDEIGCLAQLESLEDDAERDAYEVQHRISEDAPEYALADLKVQILANRIMRAGIDGPVQYRIEFPIEEN